MSCFLTLPVREGNLCILGNTPFIRETSFVSLRNTKALLHFLGGYSVLMQFGFPIPIYSQVVFLFITQIFETPQDNFFLLQLYLLQRHKPYRRPSLFFFITISSTHIKLLI